MTCPDGHEVAAGQRFCPECGQAVVALFTPPVNGDPTDDQRRDAAGGHSEVDRAVATPTGEAASRARWPLAAVGAVAVAAAVALAALAASRNGTDEIVSAQPSPAVSEGSFTTPLGCQHTPRAIPGQSDATVIDTYMCDYQMMVAHYCEIEAADVSEMPEQEAGRDAQVLSFRTSDARQPLVLLKLSLLDYGPDAELVCAGKYLTFTKADLAILRSAGPPSLLNTIAPGGQAAALPLAPPSPPVPAAAPEDLSEEHGAAGGEEFAEVAQAFLAAVAEGGDASQYGSQAAVEGASSAAGNEELVGCSGSGSVRTCVFRGSFSSSITTEVTLTVVQEGVSVYVSEAVVEQRE